VLSKDLDKKDKLKEIIGEYVALLRLDPGLPKELIGEKWIGFEAYSIFKEIKSILVS
jgi:DNA-binding transcriptional regulator PaaX